MAEPKAGYTMKEQLKVKDLIKTHEKYKNNVAEWRLLMAIYEGIKEIIRTKLINKHEREPEDTYKRRIAELFGFGYSKSVVEIFNFYLFKKPVRRTLEGLGKDKLWLMFFDDADMYGNGMDEVMMEISQYASVQGHMGILVDKASGSFENRAAQIENKAYPYMAKYHPPAILDWEFDRDAETGRPTLMWLKLKDDNEQYRIWTPDYWEIWELPKDSNGNPDDSNEEAEAVFIGGGVNPLNVIPFVWHYNQRSKSVGIGVSDIHEVARIDLSIVRNMSQIEQVINYAAFPMMRKPKREARPTDMNSPQQDDEVGVESVLEFDPDNPESKPDWLEAKVADPVKAILEVVQKKVAEIYRAANVGGMASTEIQTEAKSGVALKTEFQLLNAKLVSKAINAENSERKIVEFWLRWEEMWEEYKDKISIKRDRSYDIENLATDLENALTAQTIVQSEKFQELLQKQVARQVLPTIEEDDMNEIDKQIEEGVKDSEEPAGPPGTNPKVSVPPEDQPFMDDGTNNLQPGQTPPAQQPGAKAPPAKAA